MAQDPEWILRLCLISLALKIGQAPAYAQPAGRYQLLMSGRTECRSISPTGFFATRGVESLHESIRQVLDKRSDLCSPRLGSEQRRERKTQNP